MLKYYIKESSCIVEINQDISTNEVESILKLLEEKYIKYTFIFARIYTIPSSLANLLHQYIKELKYNIEIITNKGRLSRYFHSIGFESRFESMLTTLQVKNADIKVIVIGGSADSSEKIMQILSGIDVSKFIIIIIQHIDASGDNYFDKILAKQTNTDVKFAENAQSMKIGNIYIAPQDKHLKIDNNGKLVLEDSEKVNYARPSISVTFSSFSNYYRDKLLVILQCGYAHDGVDSLELLKNNNSTIILQDSDGCPNAKSIPSKAKDSNFYNFVLHTDEIISYLKIMYKNLDTEDEWIEYLLWQIKDKYDYDFKLYQRSSIQRRVKSFMSKHSIKSIKNVVILILCSQGAFKSLFLELSINVTKLFRRPQSYKKMIDIIQKEHQHSYKIKLWSAGCSSGEEVYSSAIILNELGLLHKSLIYATDFNPVVIKEAENGIYPRAKFEKSQQLYKELNLNTPLSYYFNINSDYVEIIDKIKEKVMFFVHNLEEDTVFNEFDIIECKNVLIYFDDVLQDRVFKLLYNSLKFGGHLFLGESEYLPKYYLDKFTQCNDGCKMYKKVA